MNSLNYLDFYQNHRPWDKLIQRLKEIEKASKDIRPKNEVVDIAETIRQSEQISELLRDLGDEYESTRLAAINTLSSIPNPPLPALFAALNSDNFNLRFSAAHILGWHQDDRIVVALSERLETEYKEQSYSTVVLDAILQALRRIGTEQSDVVLEKFYEKTVPSDSDDIDYSHPPSTVDDIPF